MGLNGSTLRRQTARQSSLLRTNGSASDLSCRIANWHRGFKRGFDIIGRVKSWEIIADNLSRAGFSWGWVSTIDSEGRTIWMADAHRNDGKCFVVRADERLTAFLELEAAIRC